MASVIKKLESMKDLLLLLLFVCVSTFVYAQDPLLWKKSAAVSKTSPVFELPKKLEPLYVVNDSEVITTEQFKAINPKHIQSIEVRHYANTIVAAQSDAARRGVVVIYLKDGLSFSEEFLSQKKNPVKN